MTARLGLGLVIALLGACGPPLFDMRRPVVLAETPIPVVSAGLKVTFVDVDEGDAELIQAGAFDVLIDSALPTRAACHHLADVLAGIHGPLEVLFITHPHHDHYGCAASILRSLDVKRVITNGERRGPPRDKKKYDDWIDFEKAAGDKGIAIESVTAGQIVTVGPGLEFKVLSTGGTGGFPDTPDGGNINNDSLTLLLEYLGRRLLFTGDIEKERGARLLKAYCDPAKPITDCTELRADVLKVPHHGSENVHPDFFKAIAPGWAVVSAGYKRKSHYLPRIEPIRALQALAAKVMSTSADGIEDIVLTISPNGNVSWKSPARPGFAWEKRPDKTYVEAWFQQ